MDSYEFWGSTVEVDEESTQAWYHNASPWGCECDGCKNFLAAAKQGLLPAPVQDALRQLQIPPEKATYVCRLFSHDHTHLYQFCYRIAGRILALSTPDAKSMTWGEGRCGHDDYPYGAPGFPEPHFDMIFYANLPWATDCEEPKT